MKKTYLKPMGNEVGGWGGAQGEREERAENKTKRD